MRFIVFEGIDGAGLSTQAARLVSWLTSLGRRAILTKEPTNNLIGGIVRAALSNELTLQPAALQLLFAADRAQHLAREIEPAIKQGKIVVCDRYALSSIAYGSMDLRPAWLKEINAPFRKPDLAFLLDVHPDVALSRIKAVRPHTELFERSELLAEIRRRFLDMKGFYPDVVVIDGNKPIEAVSKAVQQAVSRRL